jgi:hypothetical protein
VMTEGERPHPRRGNRRSVGLKDAADPVAHGLSKSLSFHSPEGGRGKRA